MILSTLRNSILLLLLGSKPIYSARNINKVLVHPEELNQTGYWGAAYHEGCDIQLYEGHGDNAGLSFEFEGSGIVARLLHCENCAQIEITIDDDIVTTVDLSIPNDVDEGFKCPQNSPSFFRTELEHGNHVIKIKRLNPSLDQELKVLELEYLTTNEKKFDMLSDLLPEAGQVGQMVKGVAKDAATLAFGGLVGYGVQYVVDSAFKGMQQSTSHKEDKEHGSDFKAKKTVRKRPSLNRCRAKHTCVDGPQDNTRRSGDLN